VTTVLLLTISNIFMTFAWYGHLRFREMPLWQVIPISWAIAFIEYLFMVPANRLGAQAGWSGFQLKIVQEAITIVVFTCFAILYLGEKPAWNNFLAFVLILAAVALTFGVKHT